MTLIEEVKQIKEEILKQIEDAKDLIALKAVQEKELAKKSRLNALMSNIKTLAGDEKIAFGKEMNLARTLLNETYNKKYSEFALEKENEEIKKEAIDISLPGIKASKGGINPFFLVEKEIIDIFVSMGYQVVEGPDVEEDYYNFERMNIPADHPAREMQDSFYISDTLLLRTHTSPAQAHAMDKANGKPLKIICPGKVYRRDDDDLTHSHQFGQIEGLVIDKKVTLKDLKGTLAIFAKRMFGEKREIRLRGSYFPFTEPSVEVDISCMDCGGKGCPTCKNSGFIEILGAGMVHPEVLKMSGYDPEIYSGFAFGLGIERVAMLRYGISDIRRFYQGDIRFIKQFKEGK